MVYEPHSTNTRSSHETLLGVARRWCPPGLEEFGEFCDELIALVLKNANTGFHLKEIVETHFGRPLPTDSLNKIVECCKALTDFVEADGSEIDENESSESLSDEDEETFLQDIHAIDVDDDLPSFQRTPFSEVATSPTYLHDKIRGLFPSQTPQECAQLSSRVLEFLSDRHSDSATVETQLTACLGCYDDNAVAAWVSEIVDARWTVVYGLAFAGATKEVEKDRIMRAIQEHAQRDAQAEILLQEITGVESASKSNTAASDEFELRPIDIRGLGFKDENACTRTKHTFPKGVQFDTHQEIVVPPAATFRGEFSKIPVSVFPEWAKQCFPESMTSLNRMQSIVYPCAFGTNDNLLVCAPTGAGKTNVALMTILRCLSEWVDLLGEGRFDNVKMVYIAPMKALVQEVVQTFSKRLSSLGIRVAELSGDSSLSKQQLGETQLIVTTPEKWDVVTRKSMDLGAAPLVRLIIIDEVHLLHNDRGPVLESIVARFKLQQRDKHLNGGTGVRFVGLSATLPNFEDVAAFLQVDRTKGLFHFDSSFREVPLNQTYCQAFKVKGMNSAEVLNTIAYKKTIEYAHHEQVMIFVHSRKDTEFTASFLLQKAKLDGCTERIMRPGSDSERLVQEHISDLEANGIKIRDSLHQLLPKGFAIHHAGMTREERNLVETLFLNRHLRVLVCTSTLAWGVNLPANVVIIKGTQVYSAEKGAMSILSVLDVLQMFGRAGRVGFGSSLGQACIITNNPDHLNYYLGVLNQQLPIESQFVVRLIDALNAEIVLGNVSSIHDGVLWLQQTYFFVRMKQNPQLYGGKPSSRDPLCLQHLHNLIHTAALHLESSKLVEYDHNTRRLKHTELGRIASHFYVQHESMKTYLNGLWEGMHDSDLFRLFALSQEFVNISVRPEESVQLRELLSCCPIAVSEDHHSAVAKVNVLLQCYISGMSLTGLPLMSELVYIKDSAQRILRSLYEIAVERGFGKTASKALEMYLMVLHKQWIVQSPLRQLRSSMATQYFEAIVDAFESRRLSWDSIRSLSLEDLQEILKRDRHAECAFEVIGNIPAFQVDVKVRPLSRKMMYLDIDVTPTFNFVDDIHQQGNRELLLTVETTDGTILLHDTLNIPLSQLRLARRDGTSGPALQCTIPVPSVTPKPCYYHVRVVSPFWIGCATTVAVDLMSIQLPKACDPLVEASDLQENSTGSEDSLTIVSVLKPYHLDTIGAQLFSSIEFFSRAQCNVLEAICDEESQRDVFAGMPAGTGKTILAEVFILKFLVDHSTSSDNSTLLYITALHTKASCRFEEWSYKFGTQLGLPIALIQPTDPVESSAKLIQNSKVVIASADAIMPLLCRGGAELHTVTHIIVDHAHLLRDSSMKSFEGAVSRITAAPYLVCNGERKARLLVLSLPLSNAQDLCKWLKISTAFNYGMSFQRLQVQFVVCDASGYHNRFSQSCSNALRMIRTEPHLRSLSKLIFVPTSRDAVSLAKRYASTLRSRQAESLDDEDFDDRQLQRLVATKGVGFITDTTSLPDLALLLHLVEEPPAAELEDEQPEGGDVDDGDGTTESRKTTKDAYSTSPVIFATFETAWKIPAAVFEAVVVCLPERSTASNNNANELSAQLFSDCSVSEVLQMTSRARDWAVVCCRRSMRFGLHQFIHEPLTLESCNANPYDFREAVNSSLAQGCARNMNDVMAVLKTHFIFQHLRSNPSYYGIHESDRGRFLSNIAGAVVLSLSDLQCCTVNHETHEVRATSFGVSVAYHCASLNTVELLQQQQGHSILSLSSSIHFLCAADELTSGSEMKHVARVRRGEYTALQVAARSLRTAFGVDFLSLDYTKPETKIYILLLVHCARWKWTNLARDALAFEDPAMNQTIASRDTLQQLEHDSTTIVTAAMQLLKSAVELLPRQQWKTIRFVQQAAQCIATGTWSDENDDIWQLPTVQRFTDLPSSSQALSHLATLRDVVASWRSSEAMEQQLELWAKTWRPSLNDDAKMSHKRMVLRRCASEGWAVDVLSDVVAKAELREITDGRFVCVVEAVANVSRGYLPASEESDVPSSLQNREYWVSCFNGKPGHEKLFAVRVERLTFAAHEGATAPYRVTTQLRAKLMFPLEDIEDESVVDIRVAINPIHERGGSECAVPLD